MNLADYIRDIPDFPKEGIVFKDITPLLSSPEAFASAIDQLAERSKGKKIDKIVGVESRGFIFGAALAKDLGIAFVPARKPGKLPYKTISESYDLEYGQAALELHEDAIAKGDGVFVIDDLLATGGTLEATCKLIERLEGQIVEIATVIELGFLNGREKLGGRPFFTLLEF